MTKTSEMPKRDDRPRNYFDHEGSKFIGRKYRRLALAMNALHGIFLIISRRLKGIERRGKASQPQNVLIVAVEVPGREGDLARVRNSLSKSRHNIEFRTVPMRDKGKLQNTNDALRGASRKLVDYDWIIMTDDDIAFPKGFMDRYIAVASESGFDISQPAHCTGSHLTFKVTKRRLFSLSRRTQYVEIGPIVFFRPKTYAEVFPFPDSRWAWGVALLWSEFAVRNEWRLGIVDACPIRHLKPVAKTYDKKSAREEALRLLTERKVAISYSEVLGFEEPLL